MTIYPKAQEIIKKFSVTDRFIKYVKINTQAKEDSETFPSSEGQREFMKMLKSELEEIGLENIILDEHSYLYATLPANLPKDFPKDKKIPKIGFLAHVDTSPDSSGENVKPIIHKNYQGGEIKLPGNNGIVINDENSPQLKDCIGLDIITADGTTLLGADDKAGVAEIVDAICIMKNNPEIYHGEIKIGFTPDEEIGSGTKHFDIAKFGAEYAYTLDGGALGELEIETFNADTFVATFNGVSYHPGYAKGKLLNSIKMAAEFIEMLPKDRFSPETTEKREGYVHPIDIKGGVEKTEIKLLVRDFDLVKMKENGKFLQDLCDKIQKKYPKGKVETKTIEYYRNMKLKLDEDPKVVDYAEEAMKNSEIEVAKTLIRGGTDGANLSYKGLLTPNLFAGGVNFHGKYEWVPVQWMEKAVILICNISQIWLEKSEK